jgi:predicted nucleotidyltransferase
MESGDRKGTLQRAGLAREIGRLVRDRFIALYLPGEVETMMPTAGQLERIAAIAGEHGLSLILQFGSTIDGRLVHPGSDIDLAVRFTGRPPPYDRQFELTLALQQVFPDGEVDLAVINHADPLFLKKITERCRLLFGTPGELQELKIYAFKRYQDHRPYFAMEREYVDRFLASSTVPDD